MTMRLSATALILACGTIAQAQIAVPPSAPIEATKPYVAPPPPPPAKEFVPGVNPGEVKVAPAPAPAPAPLPDLPYESLAKKGADGKLPVLTEPTEWAALRVNPTIQTPEDKAKVKLLLDERLRQYETIAIENIDFLHEIDNGLLDTLDVTSAQAKPNVIKIRALAGKGTLVKSLKESHSLSDVQIRFNQKIYDERAKAEYDQPAPEVKADPAKPDVSNPDKTKPDEGAKRGKAKNVSQSVLQQAVAEAMHARRVLFISAAGKIGELGSKFGFSADAVKKIGAAKTDDAKFEAVRNEIKALPVEKQRDFLKAVMG